MLTNRIKKIIFLISLTLAACGGVGAYVYYINANQGPIYDFNAARDTQPIMDIFNQNWYWLLASPDSSPSFMIKHRTYDTNPIHFGSLHLKVVREQDKLAGFTAYYMENPQQGRLLFLAVDQNFRGKGYGKMLAQRAMQELFAMGADHIALWTRVSNLPAQRIYKELGFKEMFDDNGYVFFEYWPDK
ncbi:MAG TPA: GNAT family N-acetyltransferase [Candidatus Babeliales bacterium]|jgi:ribosomal protein S18 acetylase RimI-like enzyme|nr:GNAT family N-acetyltransferase [Candidatus Babeliales bacterium]